VSLAVVSTSSQKVTHFLWPDALVGTRLAVPKPSLSAVREVAATASSALPIKQPSEASITLVGPLTPDLVLRQPLSLVAELDGDCWVVSDDVFGVYGDASTPNEALDDYISSFRDYFYLLADRAHQDDSDLAQFRRLQDYVQAVNH